MTDKTLGTEFTGELEDLRARLAVAEKALGAIRNGEADALVVERDFSDTLFDSLPGAIFLFDQTGKFLRWNANLESASGYSTEEIAQMFPLDFFSDSDKQLVQEKIMECFENGTSSVNVDIVTKTGTRTPYYFIARQVQVGAKFCLFGYGIDMSERKKAEAKIEGQLDELLRWQDVMLDREDRVQELKREVNEICRRVGETVRYPGQEGVAAVLGTSSVTSQSVGDDLRRSLARGERSRRVMLSALEDQKAANTAARESEERFRSIFEQAAVGIAQVALDGKYLAVNPRLGKILGYDEAELRSLSFQDVTHPQDLAADLDYLHRLLAGEIDTFTAEKRYVRKDRSTAWVNLTVVLVRNKKGNPGYFITVVEDIGARKQAEAERERLMGAIEQVAEMVIVADERGNIVYVNPAFEAVTGYPRAEVLGRNPSLLKSGVQDEAFYHVLWATISSGKTWQGRMVNRKKDGTFFTENATISPVRDGAGIITSYVAVKRDITRTLALEAQRLQSQKMDGIGQLAGGIAHDFNNLLTVILNYTVLAINGVREGDPVVDDLLEVKTAAERAAVLTRQILAFSRKQVLQPVALDLNQIAMGVEKMLRRILGEDIDYVQVLAPDLGLTLADPGQIEQVILNLVVNARDAMPQGGKLIIETSNVEITEEATARHVGVESGTYILLAVTDTGCGLDAQTKARLFEPFFTTKPVGEGTGLGLATIYGIVKQSGGNIWVYSEPGQGSTFKVYLPRDHTAIMATAIKPPPAPGWAMGTETILVVEDEEALRRIAARTLTAAGYTVLTARDGEEALQICGQHAGDIKLLLTDVVMPRMNGRRLAQELSKARPTLKVLYMSGYPDKVIVHHGVLESGTHLIGKPFSAADLTGKVREVLDGDITKLPDEARTL